MIRTLGITVKILPRGSRGFWWHIWKPRWHEGRGYYITIGLWLIGFYRGY